MVYILSGVDIFLLAQRLNKSADQILQWICCQKFRLRRNFWHRHGTNIVYLESETTFAIYFLLANWRSQISLRKLLAIHLLMSYRPKIKPSQELAFGPLNWWGDKSRLQLKSCAYFRAGLWKKIGKRWLLVAYCACHYLHYLHYLHYFRIPTLEISDTRNYSQLKK